MNSGSTVKWELGCGVSGVYCVVVTDCFSRVHPFSCLAIYAYLRRCQFIRSFFRRIEQQV